MTTTTTPTAIDVLRLHVGMAHKIVRLHLDGVTHEESLHQPSPGGNCLNFVLGHLLAVYGHLLELVGQPRVLPKEVLARYDRGAPPITSPDQALPLAQLLAAWDECTPRVLTGLNALTPERMATKAGFSPSGNPDETVGSLVATISWHQAYHIGQTGIIRRLLGKPGAIK